jgi:hypothetical protein
MFRQHLHVPGVPTMVGPRWRGQRMYTLSASALFVTTVVCLLVVHAAGQTNEPVWPFLEHLL